MQVTYSPILSQQISLQRLSLPNLDQNKHLLSKITDHVTTVNQELSNLDKGNCDTLNTSSNNRIFQINPLRKKKTLRTSAQILPIISRLNSYTGKPQSKTVQQKTNTYKRFNTTTSLPNPKTAFKQNKLINELKSIDEDSSTVQRSLLTDMRAYADQEKQMTRRFNKIKTLKKKLIYNADEYLQPDMDSLYIPKHSDSFYDNLDKVIDRVNGNASIDLFKAMKLISNDKVKKNSKLIFTDKKRHDQFEQFLLEMNKLSKRISKL